MKPYRTPIKNRDVIDKAISEMLDADVIKRSRSPWSFPVVIVDKKDGSKRFCVDFRKLNQTTKKNPILCLWLMTSWPYLVKQNSLLLWIWRVVIGSLPWMRKTKKRQLSLVTRVCLNLMSCPLAFQMLLQYFKSLCLLSYKVVMTLQQHTCRPPPLFLYWPFQGGTSVVVPYCYLFLLAVFILWFSYYVSDIFCKF